MTKMKIAILCDYPVHLLPGFEDVTFDGHYATWFPQIVTGFQDCSHDIHWVTFSKFVKSYQRLRFKGQTFHLLPRGKQSIQLLTAYFYERRVLSRVISSIEPDIVHGWGTEQCYAQSAVESGRASLISMQGILTKYLQVYKMPFLGRVQAKREKKTLRNANRITCESHWGINIIKRLVPSNILIDRVEYGVHDSFYKAEWEPDIESPSVIFIGSLTPRKGISDLLQAFQSDRLRGVKLYVAGSGEMENDITTLNLKNIQYLGRLKREDLICYLEKAWVLALPTWADTSPNVVKEARVVGLPLIVSENGGQEDYLEEGKNGYLNSVGNVDGLIDCILKITSDIDVCKQMGGFKHEEHRAWFMPENTVARFIEIYASMME